MNKHSIRILLEKISGYWFHKIIDLPIGTDLRSDITKRFNYNNVNIVFDVGANRGQTFMQFNRDFPKSTIFCFEPINTTFAILTKNLAGSKNAILENFAFGEIVEQKEVRLFEDWDVLNSLKEEAMNFSPDAEIQIVKVDTLDNYCSNKNIPEIDLLKIDTEGYELNVLKGAQTLLKRKNISFIYCEVGFLKKNERNTNFAVVAEFLSLYDYYFIGMYNGTSEGWKQGLYYGNALFGHADLKTGNFI